MTPGAVGEEGGPIAPGLLGAFAKSFFMVRYLATRLLAHQYRLCAH